MSSICAGPSGSAKFWCYLICAARPSATAVNLTSSELIGARLPMDLERRTARASGPDSNRRFRLRRGETGRFRQICYLRGELPAQRGSSGCNETRLGAITERNRQFESGPLRQPVFTCPRFSGSAPKMPACPRLHAILRLRRIHSLWD